MARKIWIFVLICLLARGAQAMDSRPCADPRIFPGAAVNAIVMPYRVDGPAPAPELRLASRQIAALVHLEVLTSMLKYGAVGATDLLAEADGICDVDSVVARLTQPGAPGALRAGQALVMVWGRLFGQGEQLYVQSFVRFFRQGERGPLPELLNVAAGEGAARLNLQASWPTQALAFAPRKSGRPSSGWPIASTIRPIQPASGATSALPKSSTRSPIAMPSPEASGRTDARPGKSRSTSPPA